MLNALELERCAPGEREDPAGEGLPFCVFERGSRDQAAHREKKQKVRHFGAAIIHKNFLKKVCKNPLTLSR